jgi:hypothetical protein
MSYRTWVRRIFVVATPGLLVLLSGGGGCAASYATPGRAAEMKLFAADQQADPSVVKTIDRRPMATLPTAVAIVRVQAPGYSSDTAKSWGRGAFSIVTERDIEGEDQKLVELQQRMPMCKGLAPINRLLLPEDLHSDVELRQAAGALHADMLLVYTLDTTFQVQDVAAPLSVITLGLSPNQVAHVICTASAVLMDTRNGYVYGVAEATDRQSQLASAWTSEAAVDQTRRRVEAKAFAKLVDELERTWPGVVANLQSAPATPPLTSSSSIPQGGPARRGP